MGVVERITAERLRELLSYNPDSGYFTWRVDRMCGRHMKQFAARAGDIAGNINNGRVQIRVDGRNYRAHQLAWLHVYGEWAQVEIDHRNTDATDNRIRNLRLADRYVNNQNIRRAKKGNVSGFLGVSKRGNRFVAQLTVDGRNQYLGSFGSAEEAQAVYISEKRKEHEGCTL